MKSSIKAEQGSVPHKTNIEVVLDSREERLIEVAESIQRSLGEQSGAPTHRLYIGKNGITIRSDGNLNTHKVDFSTIDRRVGGGNLSRRQTLPKAIGSLDHNVVDATAGFGADAARLALMGYRVTALEQVPIVAAMLQDALVRAKQDPQLTEAIGGRLHCVEVDATRWLLQNKEAEVVYLDPMFPPKRKRSALPPGHIQLLQSLVGETSNEATEHLFQAALKSATHRVVVKRPNHAPTMGTNPVAIHEGKLVRYEVYRPLSLGT
jgi:16S rRNA (guanine1516-N2)-methyltransferase